MRDVRHQDRRPEAAEVIDFDAHLFDACSPSIRADLILEAELLVAAFAPGSCEQDLLEMSAQLSAGARDAEMDRAHARRVAAAMKRLARR